MFVPSSSPRPPMVLIGNSIEPILGTMSKSRTDKRYHTDVVDNEGEEQKGKHNIPGIPFKL